MSALERFSQSMVSSSYCESKLVRGEAAAGAVLGEVWLICCMIVLVGKGDLGGVVSVCWLEAWFYASGDAGK